MSVLTPEEGQFQIANLQRWLDHLRKDAHAFAAVILVLEMEKHKIERQLRRSEG